MCKIVAEKIIEIFRGRSGDQASRCDLVELKQKMEEWFTGAAVTSRHLVPSNILPEKARAFEFGPIRFFHIGDLDPMDYDLSGEWVIAISFDPLRNMMRNHAACWLGEVLVEGCENERSAEIAVLAVDTALGGLQLLIPSCYSRRMARITARTLPPYCGSFSVTDTGNVKSRFANQQSGLGMSAEHFECYIDSASSDIATMGQLIAAYVSGEGDLPKLKQAWCNAVYWFHEGMSEPLNAVAIVKLETAIENLFSADSTKGSKRRILEGMEGMFGVKISNNINQTSTITFEELVNDIVEARSRVLHGNWSTLSARNQGIDREIVEGTARSFLIEYPRLLKKYAKETGPSSKDEARAFLEWAALHNSTV